MAHALRIANKVKEAGGDFILVSDAIPIQPELGNKENGGTSIVPIE